jgi:hypothetical protein
MFLPTVAMESTHWQVRKLCQTSSADVVNILGDNVDTIKKNKQTLIDTSNEINLEVNAKKTKYMLISQNAMQNHEIRIANRHIENVVQLKYLGMAVPNQNFI